MRRQPKTKKETVKITWSIHECVKVTKDGDSASSMTGYMTVITQGRKKEKLMHKTLGAALKKVGI